MSDRICISVTRTTVEVALIYVDPADLPPAYDVGDPSKLTPDDATLIGQRIVKEEIFGIPGVDVGKYAKAQELGWEPLEEGPIHFEWAAFVQDED